MNVRECRFGAVAVALFVFAAIAPTANAQTAVPGGFEITLTAGYAHEPLQGIDSIVGKFASKDGPEIMYDIGRVPQGNGPRFGGDFLNQALQYPEKERIWLKEQTVGGRKYHIAYVTGDRLIVSYAGKSQGVNLSAVAKTPSEVADVLLMALTFAEQKPKPDK